MDNQNPAAQPAEDVEVVVGKYKVKVIRKDCISAASCVAIAPDALELDGSNIAVVKAGASDPSDMLLMAAQSCPTKAIQLFDVATGALVWPQG